MERHDIADELAIPGAQELLTSATMTRLEIGRAHV